MRDAPESVVWGTFVLHCKTVTRGGGSDQGNWGCRPIWGTSHNPTVKSFFEINGAWNHRARKARKEGGGVLYCVDLFHDGCIGNEEIAACDSER
jgi:hypothetical protein